MCLKEEGPGVVVGVGVCVTDGLIDGVGVTDGLAEGVGVIEGLAVGVRVEVGVDVGVNVAVGVGVFVGVDVGVLVDGGGVEAAGGGADCSLALGSGDSARE